MKLSFRRSRGVLGGLLFSICAALGTGEEIKLGEPLPDSLGLTLTRKTDDKTVGFINLRIVDNLFQLWFLDEDSKVIEPDYPLAILQYRGSVVRRSRQNLQLLPAEGDGLYLTSPRIVPPPHDYSVRVLLMNKAEEEALNPDALESVPEDEVRREFFPVARLNQIAQEMEKADETEESED